MLEVLFGSKNAERVLQYLLSKESGYIREISQFYNVSPSVIKKQLDKFELANIIIGKNLANTRMYELNKRYPLYEELSTLLKKARSSYPDEERMKLIRKKSTRPRANKKPLIMRNKSQFLKNAIKAINSKQEETIQKANKIIGDVESFEKEVTKVFKENTKIN